MGISLKPLEIEIKLPSTEGFLQQEAFIRSKAKRRIAQAGRRGGKTTAVARIAVESFLEGRRVLYGTPTQDQIARFWFETTGALWDAIHEGIFEKNETQHIIELPGTQQRIRAKTAWNADTLRGDYADLLILDEYQLMNEDAWEVVGAPMLLDNNGDAVFIFTPPSFRSRSVSKAYDPRHAVKMYKQAEKDTTGRWEAFHWTSHDNPHISKEALEQISQDMTTLAYRQEILAEDLEEIPGALWTREMIETTRINEVPPLKRIVVGVDPQGTKAPESETGIIVAGLGMNGHGYLLADNSINARPEGWGRVVASAYDTNTADRVVVESNFGGDMVKSTIATVDPNIPVKLVHASRGKLVRAEPVSAKYEQGLIHHVGYFEVVEDQMCGYTPDSKWSPNRLDAMVWAFTELFGIGSSDWTPSVKVSEREAFGGPKLGG